MLRISKLRNERDNAPETVELDWSGLVSLLTTHNRTACAPCVGKDCRGKYGAAWSPTEFSGRRHLSNVLAVHVAVFDVDHVSLEAVAQLAGRLDAAGLAAVVHSSHSHRPPLDCAVRVVLPLSRPVTGAEWPQVRAAAIHAYGIPADPVVKDASRLYFLPSAPEGAEVLALAAEGGALNVEALLAYAVPSPTAPVAPAPVQPVPQAAAPVADAGPVDLEELRARLRRVRKAESKALAQRILKGEPLANEGARDDTLNKAVSLLACALPRTTPDEAILELLRPSVRAMPGAPPQSGDWMKDAAYKLGRARERREARDVARERWDAEVLARLQRESGALVGDDEDEAAELAPEGVDPDAEEPETDNRYTVEQLTKWAIEQGCASLFDFERRWIIQRGKAFYVFVNGRYQAPISKDDLFVSLPRDLARAPVQLTTEDADGNKVGLQPGTILQRHATVARDVQASLALQRSYYDPRSQTFFEAVRPLRRLPAREHPQIQKWIDLLGGKDAGKLTDWIATVMRLDRQSCAVYFDGPPGTGKNLLANGLARLWSASGPAELGRVLQGFNDSLINCPLIFADEQLPQQKGITAELRRLIGSTQRTLRRLYMPSCNLDGAIRLIIAGNNDRLLDTGEDLSANDLDAVAGRFLYVRAPQAAADYLKSLGGPPVVGRWITDDMLAQHALWLRDTREIAEGSRFLVEGEAQEFHEHLATGSGMAGLVCEWLVRYLTDPTTREARTLSILTGEGEVWVNTEALSGEQAWTARVPSAKVPSAAKIGRALRNLAISSERVKVGDKQHTYHRIKPRLLTTWAERAHLGDPGELQARIDRPNELIAKAKAARG